MLSFFCPPLSQQPHKSNLHLIAFNDFQDRWLLQTTQPQITAWKLYLDVNSRTVRLQLKSLTCYFVDNSCNQLAGQCSFHSHSLQTTRIKSTNYFIVNMAISETLHVPIADDSFVRGSNCCKLFELACLWDSGINFVQTRCLPGSSFGHCFGGKSSMYCLRSLHCCHVAYESALDNTNKTSYRSRMHVGCSFDSKIVRICTCMIW